MFSIIITAHNSEKHIENTLNSVLEAAKNIKREIIVVDDGSSDNTFGLLKKYDEIKLIYQNNHGVSSARNKALKYISKNSQFITFIDDSDWISNNFFSESIQFFKENKNIQVAVTPIIVKENQSERDHFLNYRFNSEKIIVNILEDYSYVHFHIGGAIFKTNLICNINNPFTDYSSIFFDAIHIAKPFYLITKDLNKFNLSRGFYNKIYKDLKLVSAKNDNELANKIKNDIFSKLEIPKCYRNNSISKSNKKINEFILQNLENSKGI
ncbi:glycosyltransferase [Staphylococcus sp. 11-B-312]|uniref:glycosyltransferase family 2 protein n=1 Tax=Staphylococcus sp. 11-B-312 TaxID=2799680 RepID=UPI0034D4CC65